MPEWRVLCGEAGAGRSTHPVFTRRFALSGPKANVKLRLQDIGRRLLADVPSVVTDLLEVAAYIHAADQAVSRGGEVRSGLGADWRRRFRFIVPVREPDRWSDANVKDSLAAVCGFLSDDDFEFDFTKQRNPPPFQSYLELGKGGAEGFQPEEVVLFSGGMDSLCGAIEELKSGKRIAIVSHNSAPKIYARQVHLADELKHRFRGRVMHIPVLATRQDSGPGAEDTQRTRTFLFGALAAGVGHIFDRERIRFYENGVMSFNLPIASQVIGSQATRTTHPRSLQFLGHFLSSLFQRKHIVENPFAWKTKTDVASLIGASAQADLIAHTVSCSRIRSMTTLHTHCGTCSQCLDRRFAVLAAGLQQHDPADMYAIDLLVGPRRDGVDRTMAEAFVRTALEYRRMTPDGFFSRYAGEVARALSAFSDMQPDDVARATHELHKRHGEAVHTALTTGVERHASDLIGGRLPTSCILRLAVSDPGYNFDETPIMDIPVARPDSESQRTMPPPDEIRLALDEDNCIVLISGLPPIDSRADYALLIELEKRYRSDVQAGKAPENHRYAKAADLARSLSIEQATLRRRVMRLRRRVAELYEKHMSFPLYKDDFIENKEWRGYRLNPRVRVLAKTELDGKKSQDRGGKSQLSAKQAPIREV